MKKHEWNKLMGQKEISGKVVRQSLSCKHYNCRSFIFLDKDTGDRIPGGFYPKHSQCSSRKAEA